MQKKLEIDDHLLKLITNKNVAAVDLDNKIIYLKHEEKEDMVKFTAHGYKVYTVGEINFVDTNAGKYVMPVGCSPADIIDGNTAVTALHCVADADMQPRKSTTMFVINDALPEVAKVEASLKSYTPVKKCGWLCKLFIFFRRLPKTYINLREVAWLETPVNLNNYKPLPKLETIGVLTATNAKGDYMIFSPLPGKEDKIRPGVRIAYISYNYRENRTAYTETVITGYVLTNIVGFIFYLPYAYEPGKVLAIPGYSGSAVKLIDINNSSELSNV
jgi:hypothetical protein